MFHQRLSLRAAALAGIVTLLSAASVRAQARDPQIEALIASHDDRGEGGSADDHRRCVAHDPEGVNPEFNRRKSTSCCRKFAPVAWARCSVATAPRPGARRNESRSSNRA